MYRAEGVEAYSGEWRYKYDQCTDYAGLCQQENVAGPGEEGEIQRAEWALTVDQVYNQQLDFIPPNYLCVYTLNIEDETDEWTVSVP